MPKRKSIEPSTSWSPLPFRLYSKATPERYMFCKPHVVEDEGVDNGTRLFVASIPAGILEEEFVRFMMDVVGPVEQVAMHGSRTSAMVVFESATPVKKFLGNLQKKRSKVHVMKRVDRKEPYGLKGWVTQHKTQYNLNTNAALQKQLDDWIDAFEDREARQKEEAMRALEEDGWTVVRRFKGRKKNANEADGITVGAVAPAAARDIASRSQQKVAKRSEGQGADFYRSNTREKRRSELIDLRERFEEDRQRLLELKKARNFKPVIG